MTPVLRLGVVAAVLFATAGAALAADMAAVAHERHEKFKEIGKNMKGIVDELKTGQVRPADVQGYAKRIAELAPQIPTWFPEGSGPGHGFKTQAKAEIWERPAEFRKDASDMAAAASRLYEVSMTGDAAAIAAQTKTLGGACKTCHDAFRLKDDD